MIMNQTTLTRPNLTVTVTEVCRDRPVYGAPAYQGGRPQIVGYEPATTLWVSAHNTKTGRRFGTNLPSMEEVISWVEVAQHWD
jgi:hypothetical protein